MFSLRPDSRLQDHSHPLHQHICLKWRALPRDRIHQTRLMLEESMEDSHPETEHTSYFGAKSFKQFDTGSADNRRRKHLTIVLHKDIMRKSGLYSRESRKTLKKSLDKLRARFNNRCCLLLHCVSPPGLLLGGRRRGVLLNLLLSLLPGWGSARYPHRAYSRSEVTQEFAVQLLKCALICLKAGV